MQKKGSIASRRSFADAQDDKKGAFLLSSRTRVAEVKDQRGAIFVLVDILLVQGEGRGEVSRVLTIQSSGSHTSPAARDARGDLS